MQITFDPFNATERSFVKSLLDGGVRPSSGDAGVPHSPPPTQPEVVHNTGTVVTGFAPFPPGDDGGEGEATDLPASPAENTFPKKRGRKPAETAQAPTPKDGVKPLTLDDVRTALQAYASVHGVASSLELLSTFDAQRISELKEEEYADFIRRCAV